MKKFDWMIESRQRQKGGQPMNDWVSRYDGRNIRQFIQKQKLILIC